MKVFSFKNAVPVKAWTEKVSIESSALQQLINVANIPFIHKHIAVMPDVHWGKGATIGSVIPTIGAIIPAAVGVDIGCGMMAVQTSLTANDLPEDLKEMRSNIEAAVPHGRTNNGGPGDRGAWCNTPFKQRTAWYKMEPVFDSILCKHPKIGKNVNHVKHLGTLGGGNHFIEICLDENDKVWVMLHSGSRGVGNRIGSYFIELAKKDMEKWFINLPDKDLSYFPIGTDYFNDYCEAVSWAQNFAKINRELMMKQVLIAMSKIKSIPPFDPKLQVVDCHHNYVSWEHHYGKNVMITRKGAVRAREGDMGIIPGSMGTKSFIVRGKGNPESFNSCSHGAGRLMSRKAAKKMFTVESHKVATMGIECKKDESVIDETPGAYKNIDDVMESQKDLVDIVHTLNQVICVKG